MMLMSIPECEVCIDRLTRTIAAVEASEEYNHDRERHKCGSPSCLAGWMDHACGGGLSSLNSDVTRLSHIMRDYIFEYGVSGYLHGSYSFRHLPHPGTRAAALDRARRVLRYAQNRLEVMTREMERVDRPHNAYFLPGGDPNRIQAHKQELRAKRGPVYRFKRYRKAVAV